MKPESQPHGVISRPNKCPAANSVLISEISVSTRHPVNLLVRVSGQLCSHDGVKCLTMFDVDLIEAGIGCREGTDEWSCVAVGFRSFAL